jgi:hypothetical protein
LAFPKIIGGNETQGYLSEEHFAIYPRMSFDPGLPLLGITLKK